MAVRPPGADRSPCFRQVGSKQGFLAPQPDSATNRKQSSDGVAEASVYRILYADSKVFVNLTKEAILQAPEFQVSRRIRRHLSDLRREKEHQYELCELFQVKPAKALKAPSRAE
jgi:hypothetical protein